jgi:hypothetical protein
LRFNRLFIGRCRGSGGSDGMAAEDFTQFGIGRWGSNGTKFQRELACVATEDFTAFVID